MDTRLGRKDVRERETFGDIRERTWKGARPHRHTDRQTDSKSQ